MLLFMDGCSHYSTSELAQKWTAVDSTGCTFTIDGSGGRSGDAIKRASTSTASSPGYLTKSPLFTQSGTWTQTATGTFGCALKIDDLTKLTGGVAVDTTTHMAGCFLLINNGSNATCGFAINPNGTISAYRYAEAVNLGPILLGTSVNAITSDEWTYLEFNWTLNTVTSGVLEVKSNGTRVLYLTGIRTCPNAADMSPFAAVTPLWNSVAVMGQISTAGLVTMRMCDVYLIDNVAPNDTFLGDVQVAYIKPDGAGAETNWTPSAGANWQCVDEVPPNSDTDYVSTTAAATRDTYTFENVTGNPICIQVCVFARKETSAGASLSVITRQSATDYDGPEQGLGSTSYAYQLQPYDTNPATSAQWTESQMNAGEWGPLKVS